MRTTTPTDGPDESGFSLVELVVSMVLLALIAMAFLPLVAHATQAAASGARIATATRLVSAQMELARAPGTTCTTLRQALADVDVRDGRGATYRVTKTVGPCPGLVRYSVSVAQTSAPTLPLATASTYVSVVAP